MSEYVGTLHGAPYGEGGERADVDIESLDPEYLLGVALRTLCDGQHLCVWEGETLVARYARSAEYGVTETQI